MSPHAINRRSFLKLGSLGVALGAGTTHRSHAEDPTAGDIQPGGPVRRTLGRTGLKVTAVSIGAMRTSEPDVLKAVFDRGVNFVHTGRNYMGGPERGHRWQSP